MRKSILLLFSLLSLLSFIGCASGYGLNRLRDASDIITVTGGLGAGAKSRIGPINLGLIVNAEYGGLRGGGFYHIDKEDYPNADVQLILIGCEECRFNQYSKTQPQRLRKKDFVTGNLVLPASIGEPPDIKSFSYYTQMDLVVGAGPSLRVGVNPGEFLDFLLGLFLIDIYTDDIGWLSKRVPSIEDSARAE